MLKLRDIMTRDVISVSPELPLDQLVELFVREHVGGVPVVSEGKVVGVISSTDVLTFAMRVIGKPRAEEEGAAWGNESGYTSLEAEELPAGYFTSLWEAGDVDTAAEWSELSSEGRGVLFEYTVADAMSSDVLSLPPDTDAVAAADLLRKKGVHRVLVIEDGRLQGIVSGMDIVRSVATQQFPAPRIISSHEADFDTGWRHEPIVGDSDPFPVRSLGMLRATPSRWSHFREELE